MTLVALKTVAGEEIFVNPAAVGKLEQKEVTPITDTNPPVYATIVNFVGGIRKEEVRGKASDVARGLGWR